MGELVNAIYRGTIGQAPDGTILEPGKTYEIDEDYLGSEMWEPADKPKATKAKADS